MSRYLPRVVGDKFRSRASEAIDSGEPTRERSISANNRMAFISCKLAKGRDFFPIRFTIVETLRDWICAGYQRF